LSVNAFEQHPLPQVLAEMPSQIEGESVCNQLMFNY
jgi:hypothetical protein